MTKLLVGIGMLRASCGIRPCLLAIDNPFPIGSVPVSPAYSTDFIANWRSVIREPWGIRHHRLMALA